MLPDELTPVRRRVAVETGALGVLSEPAVAYQDGGEKDVLALLAGATDLSSTSDELAGLSTDWATEYATSRSRANFLRALDIPRDAVVLEVGGGNGAISRYLGEACATVDMVEPMPHRAAAAVLRTRDLPTVRIFQGVLDDVPAEPTYDVVVVCGVLEYIGAGSKSDDPYVDFLTACAARLKPNGNLILAIENAIGVKYLAGASEDHTGRPFDGLEGYLLPTGARTFTRAGLEFLVRSAGLTPTTYGAFPDYKLTRAVMSRELLDAAPQAMADIPAFPSRDYSMLGIEGADEHALWRQLVEAGTAFEHCNSWVVVASKGDSGSLWPTDRLASLVLAERGSSYVSRTDFTRTEGEVTVTRRGLVASAPGDDAFVWVGGDEPLVRGPLLSNLVADESTRSAALRAWRELVEATPGNPVDLVPWNVISTPHGPVSIDQEWYAKDYPLKARLARGLVLSVARHARESRWLPGEGVETVLDTARRWSGEAGIPLADADIVIFIEREAAFQEHLAGPAREEGRKRLEALLASRLCDVRGTTRIDLDAASAGLAGRAVATAQRLAQLELELNRHQEHKEHADAAYQALEGERLRLESSYRDLETSYRALETSYLNVESSHRGLESSHRELEASYRALESSYRDLEVSYRSVDAALAEREAQWNGANERPVRFAWSAMRRRMSRASRRPDPPPAS